MCFCVFFVQLLLFRFYFSHFWAFCCFHFHFEIISTAYFLAFPARVFRAFSLNIAESWISTGSTEKSPLPKGIMCFYPSTSTLKHHKKQVEPRKKKNSYFPLNPGWLRGILLISFNGFWNNPLYNWVVFHPPKGDCLYFPSSTEPHRGTRRFGISQHTICRGQPWLQYQFEQSSLSQSCWNLLGVILVAGEEWCCKTSQGFCQVLAKPRSETAFHSTHEPPGFVRKVLYQKRHNKLSRAAMKVH